MIRKVAEATRRAGIPIANADEYEIILALENDPGHQVKFVGDGVMIGLALEFTSYGFCPETDNELDKMHELEDFIKDRMENDLIEQGYHLENSEIGYGVEEPDFRVLLMDYFKEIRSLKEAVEEITWARNFILEKTHDL